MLFSCFKPIRSFVACQQINIVMDKKSLIKKILLAFEQSSTKIKYDKIYLFEDGPNNKKQITVSFGVTEYGNLKKMIKDYCFKNGVYSKQLSTYVADIGMMDLTFTCNSKTAYATTGTWS